MTNIKIRIIILISLIPILLPAQDSLNVTWVGSCLSSDARKVAYAEISGNPYLFIHLSGGVMIVDISDPTNPQRVREIGTPGDIGYGWIGGLRIVDSLLYVADGSYGLWIYNVSNPSSPVRIGTCRTREACGVAVSGNYAYVATDSGLAIVDISHPANPVIKSYLTWDLPYYWHAADVVVEDTIAYIAGFRKLIIANVADPDSPAVIATWHPHLGIGWEDYILQVDKQGNYLYLANFGWGFYIVDVSNPHYPITADSIKFNIPLFAFDIVAEGNYAYGAAGNGHGIVIIIDISNPYNASVVSTLETPGYSQGIDCSGSNIFVADLNETLVIDASDPYSPSIIGVFNNLNSFASDVAISNNYAFVAQQWDGLRVVDISNPSSPQEVASLTYSSPVREIEVAGNYAYISAEDAGLRIIDITNPLSPYEVGYCDTIGRAENVAIQGNFAYVCGGSSFKIIDISNPSVPTVVASITGPYNNAQCIVAQGDYVFIALTQWIEIINISNPYSPYIISKFFENSGLGIAVRDNFLYTIAGGFFPAHPFAVIDVSDPSSPVIIDTLTLYLSENRGMAIEGNYAFLSYNSTTQVLVIDISQPHNLELAGYYGFYAHDNIFPSHRIAVSNNYLYVPDGDRGLRIYRFIGGAAISETINRNEKMANTGLTAYPNPFSHKLCINCYFPTTGLSNFLKIYNSSGRLVKEWNFENNTIVHRISWDGTDNHGMKLPGGVYFCNLTNEKTNITRKVVLVR